MNGIKRVVAVFLLITITMIATACQNNNAPMEYMNANESYSITLPESWIQDTGVSNGDMLVLYSNEERDIIISVQKFDREVAEDTMGLDSLERFEQYYKTNSIVAGLYTLGEVEQKEYTMQNMKNVLAEELVSDASDNTVVKAFGVMAESENAYYTCTITGEQKVYDKNINELKEVLSALIEK